ncbi:hypothetical protein IQ230_22915 [Gloeocapsopsis crepidinum LEGE 06123]|uniref:Uncharacterized protein n=1 Tax=Gloeocapsopsis crepidinum LEGE 06123 TaxID=588587 RepID=A0ABR9V0X4_9CHRO|nr:hypothetical protein [Gloeocapsopsis crepidinum]MBE9193148.1 hypothetical protein [Gloeocapsopsis crepidinum LEGE 06123]
MSNAPGLTAKNLIQAISWKPVVFLLPQRFRECAIATSNRSASRQFLQSCAHGVSIDCKLRHCALARMGGWETCLLVYSYIEGLVNAKLLPDL